MPTRSKKRVAIYARVSTLDKGQDPETQLLQLREYARRRGFDVADEYVDHATEGVRHIGAILNAKLLHVQTEGVTAPNLDV